MLKGAYSNLSFKGKFLLLIILIVAFLLFASMLGLICLVPFYGTDVLSRFANPDYSDASLVNAIKFLQIINMAFGMLLPTWLFIWLTEKEVLKYSGLSINSGFLPLLSSAVLIIISQPLIGYASELNSMLVLPSWLAGMESWMKEMEEKGKLITDLFLGSSSPTDLLINIFMIALLPAVTEELLFRGALSKMLFRWSGNIHVAVMISALIFSAIHLQFYGFLPRFLLGVLLGYLFLWSGNLWLPITAHFINNFLSVIVEFFYKKGTINTDAESFGTNSGFLFILLSLVFVISLMYWTYKYFKNNHIGLQENTTNTE